MKEKIKKVYEWPGFPFLILSLVIFILTCILKMPFFDDVWFIDNTTDVGIFSYLKWRYSNWTSRVVIEFVQFILCRMGLVIQRLFISIMFGLCAWAISRVFVKDDIDKSKKRKINWLIVFGILLFNTETYMGAGIVATIINYLFPITMGICTLIFCKKMILNQKVKKYEYVVYLVEAIIATNIEQMCAILLVVYFICFIYNIVKNKKVNAFIIILFLISILGFVNIFVCEGNKVRTESETQLWYPEFADFSIIDKIELGIFTVIDSCFNKLNFAYIILSFIIMFEILKKYDNVLVKGISIISVLGGLIFTVFKPIISMIFPNLYSIHTEFFANYNPVTTNNLILIPYCLIIAYLFISIICLFKKDMKTVMLILILGAGFMSKFIMGFSPTVFASGNRTTLILYLSLVIAIIVIVEKYDEKYLSNLLNIFIACLLIENADNIANLGKLGLF